MLRRNGQDAAMRKAAMTTITSASNKTSKNVLEA